MNNIFSKQEPNVSDEMAVQWILRKPLDYGLGGDYENLEKTWRDIEPLPDRQSIAEAKIEIETEVTNSQIADDVLILQYETALAIVEDRARRTTDELINALLDIQALKEQYETLPQFESDRIKYLYYWEKAMG